MPEQIESELFLSELSPGNDTITVRWKEDSLNSETRSVIGYFSGTCHGTYRGDPAEFLLVSADAKLNYEDTKKRVMVAIVLANVVSVRKQRTPYVEVNFLDKPASILVPDLQEIHRDTDA